MKVLIVDDHPLILHALQQVLPELDPSLELLGAENRTATLTLLARHPDCALVLLDLTLPGAHGLDLLAELRRDQPLAADRRSLRHARSCHGRRGARCRRAWLHRQDRQSVGAARRDSHGAVGGPARHVRHRSAAAHDRRRADRCARPHAAPVRCARAARAGQAQQDHLPRSALVGRHGEGARQRDPEGAQRAFARRRRSWSLPAAESASTVLPTRSDARRRSCGLSTESRRRSSPAHARTRSPNSMRAGTGRRRRCFWAPRCCARRCGDMRRPG